MGRDLKDFIGQRQSDRRRVSFLTILKATSAGKKVKA